jgi:hypothetical protein
MAPQSSGHGAPHNALLAVAWTNLRQRSGSAYKAPRRLA